MNNENNSLHLPFAQLPPEARVLFSFMMMTIYGPERPPVEKVYTDLEMIWDSEKLTLDDFRKPGRIKEVFDKYAKVFRKDACWLGLIGVSREEAERAGFLKRRRSRCRGVSRSPKAA